MDANRLKYLFSDGVKDLISLNKSSEIVFDIYNMNK